MVFTSRLWFVRAGIDQLSILTLQKRRERMLFGRLFADDVVDMPACNGESIGDKRAVAAPWHGLGTHDSDQLVVGEIFQFGKARVKFGSSQIVSVAAKRRVVPTSVARVFRGTAQSSQGRQMAVVDSTGVQCSREEVDAKLWVFT